MVRHVFTVVCNSCLTHSLSYQFHAWFKTRLNSRSCTEKNFQSSFISLVNLYPGDDISSLHSFFFRRCATASTTWNEILVKRRNKSHPVPVHKLEIVSAPQSLCHSSWFNWSFWSLLWYTGTAKRRQPRNTTEVSQKQFLKNHRFDLFSISYAATWPATVLWCVVSKHFSLGKNHHFNYEFYNCYFFVFLLWTFTP